MQYRKLGRSGLDVSPLALGTMLFGDATSEADAQAIIADAAGRGVNFIDTADGYAGGRSEEIVGRAIKADRDKWVVATKFGNKRGDAPNSGGTSRRWAIQCCEQSLRRMGTDYIDVLYLHKEDHSVPLGETVRALADLVRQGKIRYFGVSNYKSWRVAEICRLADEYGIDRPVVSQPYYNLVNRMPETEHLTACGYFGLGVFPYSPLARGILSGKYAPGAAPVEGSRIARGDKRALETEWRDESLHVAQQVKARAEAVGITASQFATAWVLNNALITGIVAGPRTMAQWQDYVAALDYSFTAEDEAFCDGLVAAGHPSTPGYNDPQYGVEGRVSRV